MKRTTKIEKLQSQLKTALESKEVVEYYAALSEEIKMSNSPNSSKWKHLDNTQFAKELASLRERIKLMARSPAIKNYRKLERKVNSFSNDAMDWAREHKPALYEAWFKAAHKPGVGGKNRYLEICNAYELSLN